MSIEIDLTYLIGRNSPIDGCRPAHYASWLHQSMTGLPRFGPSNEYKVVLFAEFRRSPHHNPSRWSLLHTNDMAEPAQMLHNVYVVEEPIQLTIESNAEIIANLC